MYDQSKQRVIKKVIDQVRLNHPVSLFSNLNRSALLETLRIVDLPKDWFAHLLTGDDIAERKPALDGFYRIIELSKLPPAEILYIGDREKADIIPAKKVGLKTCLVYGQSPQADFSCARFADILNLVTRLTK